MIDYKKFVEGSRNFLKNYIIDNRLKSCVLGISGGIDSTVSACIAYPVCKKLSIPLIGRSLPCNTNKKDENDTATLVGKSFCTDFKVVSIEPMYRVIDNELELNEGILNPLQQGNIKARLRMIYLRNLASIHRGVVLDNDNFTEWNLGFWTMGGDSPMDINLGLHYLWKTEIYELAYYLLEQYNIEWKAFDDFETPEIAKKADDAYAKYAALKASIELIPTDGNGVSSSDCEQFGLDNYKQVDDVLITMYYRSGFEQAFSSNSDQYIRLIDDYNEQGVDSVMVRHQNTEFKRKPQPIFPKREELEL